MSETNNTWTNQNTNSVSSLTLEDLEATYNQFVAAMKDQVAYVKVSLMAYHRLRAQWDRAIDRNKSQPDILRGLRMEVSDFVPDNMAVGFDLDGNIVRVFLLQENNG